MKIILAPDSYKGSLRAVEACDAMARGVQRALPDAGVVAVPMGDGGEGTLEALLKASGGLLQQEWVHGPLMEKRQAAWGMLGNQAMVEVATASGLMLLDPDQRNPMIATSRGVGELIKAGLDKGLRRFLIGLGGSATVDGGSGMLRALGARFLDFSGCEIAEGGAGLAALDCIDLSSLDARLQDAEIILATDVDNPLLGPAGAARVYGPQKGASPSMVGLLENAVERYAQVAHATSGRDMAQAPGAGAAGGLGAAFLYFTPAKVRPGVEVVLEACHFEEKLQGAHLVITGEGKTDAQTLRGKVPFGVAKAAKRHGVPVVCISGSIEQGAEALLGYCEAVIGLQTKHMSRLDAMNYAAMLLESAVTECCTHFASQQRLEKGASLPSSQRKQVLR